MNLGKIFLAFQLLVKMQKTLPTKISDEKNLLSQLSSCLFCKVNSDVNCRSLGSRVHLYALFYKHTSYLKSVGGVRDCGSTSIPRSISTLVT